MDQGSRRHGGSPTHGRIHFALFRGRSCRFRMRLLLICFFKGTIQQGIGNHGHALFGIGCNIGIDKAINEKFVKGSQSGSRDGGTNFPSGNGGTKGWQIQHGIRSGDPGIHARFFRRVCRWTHARFPQRLELFLGQKTGVRNGHLQIPIGEFGMQILKERDNGMVFFGQFFVEALGTNVSGFTAAHHSHDIVDFSFNDPDSHMRFDQGCGGRNGGRVRRGRSVGAVRAHTVIFIVGL
mmetsp:Transcript_19902/g.41530  ORF Transcript_19902/g.41530 Transcript_19902/m.41530 type:complete len:237 (-) Transcript_19902:742-1452(-)